MEMKQHELEWKEIGKAEGKAEGLEEGKTEERRNGIRNVYSTALELSGSAEDALRIVCGKYPEFSPEQIRQIISEKSTEKTEQMKDNMNNRIS